MANYKLALAGLLLIGVVGMTTMEVKTFPTDEEIETWNFKGDEIELDSVAPDFTLELIGEEPFSLAGQIGEKVVVLNFWASWCGPCVTEMPEMNHLVGRYAERPFVLIGVNSEEPERTVSAFIDQHALTFAVGIGDHHLSELYGVNSLPTTIVIGADGRIAYAKSGAIRNSDVALGPTIEEELAIIEKGEGITAEQFQALQKERASKEENIAEEVAGLEGKQKEQYERIIGSIECPCGCGKKLDRCQCSDAKRGRRKVATDIAEGERNREDDHLIAHFNERFCKVKK